MENYQERLAQMQETWDNGKTEHDRMFGVCSVKKGEYNFKLSETKLVEAGEYIAISTTQAVITECEFEGSSVQSMQFLGSNTSNAFIRRWIEKLGWEAPEDLADLPDVLADITQEEPCFKGVLSFYNDRPQINVLELLESGESGGEQEPDVEDGVEPEPEPEDETADKLLTQMQTFCATYSIAVDEEADFDTLKEAIGELEYEAEDVDEEERQLLTDLGLEHCIKEPPKPKPAVKKAPAKKSVVSKAPVKKSVKKSVKKKRK